MDENGSASLRLCLDGHANSLALNKENNCIAVAGRSREFFSKIFPIPAFLMIQILLHFSVKGAEHRK